MGCFVRAQLASSVIEDGGVRNGIEAIAFFAASAIGLVSPLSIFLPPRDHPLVSCAHFPISTAEIYGVRLNALSGPACGMKFWTISSAVLGGRGDKSNRDCAVSFR
jgi:hypothetical protein